MRRVSPPGRYAAGRRLVLRCRHRRCRGTAAGRYPRRIPYKRGGHFSVYCALGRRPRPRGNGCRAVLNYQKPPKGRLFSTPETEEASAESTPQQRRRAVLDSAFPFARGGRARRLRRIGQAAAEALRPKRPLLPGNLRKKAGRQRKMEKYEKPY